MAIEDSAPTAAQAAAAAINAAQATIELTVGGAPGAELAECVFDRLSVERRVLGHITDEVDADALGPRNTLAALTYALMRDPNTTRPVGRPKLDIDGATLEQVATLVDEHLQRLVAAGLAAQREDGSFELTEAGHTELAS